MEGTCIFFKGSKKKKKKKTLLEFNLFASDDLGLGYIPVASTSLQPHWNHLNSEKERVIP